MCSAYFPALWVWLIGAWWYGPGTPSAPQVGNLVIFCIKLMVSATTAFIAFEWIKGREDVPLVGLVVFVIALVAWFIADAFASVYEMVSCIVVYCGLVCGARCMRVCVCWGEGGRCGAAFWESISTASPPAT